MLNNGISWCFNWIMSRSLTYLSLNRERERRTSKTNDDYVNKKDGDFMRYLGYIHIMTYNKIQMNPPIDQNV